MLMRYLTLAGDFDETLASEGRMAPETIAALDRMRASGRQLLVTGRELDEFLAVFPSVHLFDCIVGEKGAALYHPAHQHTTLLSAPPEAFIRTLPQRQACSEFRGVE